MWRRIRPQRRHSAPVPAPNATLVSSFEEYRAHLANTEVERERRRSVERVLVGGEAPFKVQGWCAVCCRWADLAVDFSFGYEVAGRLSPNWREHLTCPGCGLNNRGRASVHFFQLLCAPDLAASMFITEKTTPLFRVLRRKYRGLVGSEFFGESVPRGLVNADGVRNEDLTRLTFGSDSFDHILTFDVLEHMPDYRAAGAECWRCLRPGGSLLFSVPFTGARETIRRAHRLPDGSIEHLLPPEYHGDPIREEGCLCFHDFGWDLLDDLRRVGFEGVVAVVYWSRELGYLGGGEQMLFWARKPGAPCS